jgi:hypothetical protein
MPWPSSRAAQRSSSDGGGDGGDDGGDGGGEDPATTQAKAELFAEMQTLLKPRWFVPLLASPGGGNELLEVGQPWSPELSPKPSSPIFAIAGPLGDLEAAAQLCKSWKKPPMRGRRSSSRQLHSILVIAQAASFLVYRLALLRLPSCFVASFFVLVLRFNFNFDFVKQLIFIFVLDCVFT